jgi:hypothetical protein
MKHVELRPGVTIKADGVAESFTRDMEGEDGVVTARDKASTVEIRVDVRGVEPMDDAARDRLLEHPDVDRSGRHTVVLKVSTEGSRHRNLEEARRRMKILVLEAIDDEVPQPPEPEEPAKRARAGLIKGRGQT